MADEPEHTIAEDIVMTKYKLAGEIVNRVLKQLVEKCIVGANVYEICVEGDGLLEEETSKVFKKDAELKKGIAFPTTVSLNNCICHFSPLKTDPEVLLKEGDLLKLDLGAHIDGFIAVVAHTLVVGQKEEKGSTKGRLADVILAAHSAAEVAIRTLKPGKQNFMVTDLVTKAAEDFDCKPVQGMLSYQLKQHSITGDKSIIQNPSEAQRKDVPKADIAGNEVYAMDVIISTGEGKPRELDNKATTIYKKTDLVYQLKMKASRALYSEVDKKFGLMPFNLRSLGEEDLKKKRLGLHECIEHKLLDPYNVMHEKEGELVAQFKFTVLVTENGTSHKITGLPLDTSLYASDKAIKDEAVKSILATPINPSKKKKSAAAPASAAVPATGDEAKNGS